ncbi:DUF4097 family beta strand repeat-containing protein [Niabella drilacis]|uniref:DUF4097 and DUF4098 domain-containing protein YvlB n=1 Tax=Niabella drilacis (strain DSM 25811 / CCM 8410 / CCUG 62505 / LMG 26954 / E90) TaxID=1285928 RepID=A0A1G7AKB5_NIADE|nr:DUF4097 family beta strand repeat-containing protein [Niabella drilacis]SDE14455.1 DUF4097 and DUF4098 domain-containing protein YvlB [Niabella drilacis]
MKKNFLLLMFIFGAGCSVAQGQSDKTPYLTKTFNAASVKTVKAETSGGFITVEGGNAPGLVEVYVTASNFDRRRKMSEADIRSVLERYYDLEVRTSGNELIARATRKDRTWNEKTALSISFKIHTGAIVNTDLRTSGGSIALLGVKGDQHFRTSGGSLRVREVTGNITGRTSGGGIEVSDAQDEIDLATSGGSIHADHLKGNIRLKTSGGSLSLSDLSGRIEAHTSGGSITASEIKGDLLAGTSGGSVTLRDIDGNLDAHTSGGGITATLTGTKDFVKLRTSAGSVKVDMPGTGNARLDLKGSRVNVSRLGNFNGSIEKDRVKGTIGSGKLLVEVAASSGNVNLNM